LPIKEKNIMKDLKMLSLIRDLVVALNEDEAVCMTWIFKN
jgi:hypothetical protein